MGEIVGARHIRELRLLAEHVVTRGEIQRHAFAEWDRHSAAGDEARAVAHGLIRLIAERALEVDLTATDEEKWCDAGP